MRRLPALMIGLAALAATSGGLAADTDGVITAEMAQALASWTSEHAQAGTGTLAGTPGFRVDVKLGRLDPRLRLAPCARIEPYLPGNSRPWGRTRVGLRCVDGPTRWNVFLPVQVHVFAPATVLNTPLPAGAEITPDHLTEAEVDWADGRQPPVTDPSQLIGRRLTRAVAAGDPLRATDLQRAVWFQAGDTVKLVALGPGFEVSAQGQALARGVDGQSVRVRTTGGRIVSGTAVGERRVEMPL